MRLFFKVSGIVFVLLVFMGCGVLIGAKKPNESAKTTTVAGRFQPIGSSLALDTKSGLTCDKAAGIDESPHTLVDRTSRKVVHPPAGITLEKWPDQDIPGDEKGYPYCSYID